MKSKTSFYNATVLRSDVTRFSPVWILYTIGFLLVQMMALSRCMHEYEMAHYMESLIQVVIAVNGVYALIVSQMLFGDLLNTRMCNALHAMPLTRDDFFRTHAFAGFCFSILPNALVLLISLPLLGKAAPTVMYVAAAAVGSYVFYFGTALLALQLSGNRIGAVLIYGLLNFWALLIIWFARYLVEPMMYGVELPIRETLVKFCPTWDLLSRDYLKIVGSTASDYRLIQLEYIKRNPCWGSLGIWTIVGLIAMAAAQVLYRKRKLEAAGDVVAYRKIMPVFLVMISLMTAGFTHVAAHIMGFTSGLTSLLFVAVGLIIGWFIGLMLMDRQLRVFRWKRMIPLAGILAVFALGVGLVVGDAFGVVNRVPTPEETEAIRVYTQGWEENSATVKDPELMQQLIAFHQSELDAYNRRGLLNKISGNANYASETYYDGGYDINLVYELKNGSELKRTYEFGLDDQELELIKHCLNQPDAVFNMEFSDPSQLAEKILSVSIHNNYTHFSETNLPVDRAGLLNAVLADCSEDTMAAGWMFHRGEVAVAGIEIEYDEPDPRYLPDEIYYIEAGRQVPRKMTGINVFNTNRHTIAWLIEHGYLTQEQIDEAIVEWRY